MPLPTSGQLSFSAIATELGLSLSNLSLRSMSNTAGFSTPDAVSEFYGYSNITYTFFDYMWGGYPCMSLMFAVYQGSDGKYYVELPDGYTLISNVSDQWYSYAYYDEWSYIYVWNIYYSNNGYLNYGGYNYNYCAPY